MQEYKTSMTSILPDKGEYGRKQVSKNPYLLIFYAVLFIAIIITVRCSSSFLYKKVIQTLKDLKH